MISGSRAAAAFTDRAHHRTVREACDSELGIRVSAGASPVRFLDPTGWLVDADQADLFDSRDPAAERVLDLFAI